MLYVVINLAILTGLKWSLRVILMSISTLAKDIVEVLKKIDPKRSVTIRRSGIVGVA